MWYLFRLIHYASLDVNTFGIKKFDLSRPLIVDFTHLYY